MDQPTTNPQLNRIGILDSGEIVIGMMDLPTHQGRPGTVVLRPEPALALGMALIFKALMVEVLREMKSEEGSPNGR